MTTYVIYPESTSGYIKSQSTDFNAARAGSNLVASTTDANLFAGQESRNGQYFVYQTFLSFNTALIPDTDRVVDAQISINSQGFLNLDIGQLFYAKTWRAGGLTTADWVPSNSLAALPMVSNIDYRIATGGGVYRQRVTGREGLITSINKTGYTEIISSTNRVQNGNAPEYRSGSTPFLEYARMDSAVSSQGPALYVYSVNPNTLNLVGAASTQLSDGTQISVRSNGAALPTLTLGYTDTTQGTTFNTIEVLPVGGADLRGRVYITEGLQPMAIASGPDNRVYVFFADARIPSFLVVRRYRRNANRTFTYEDTRSQQFNERNGPINSISASYVPGVGTQARDSILVVLGHQTTESPQLSWGTVDVNFTQSTPMFIETSSVGGIMIPASFPIGTTLVGGQIDTDVIPFQPGIVAVSALNTFVVQVINGAITRPVTRYLDTPSEFGGKVRVIGLDASTFALVRRTLAGQIILTVIDTQMNVLRNVIVTDALLDGDAPAQNWDAYFNGLTRSLSVFYRKTTDLTNTISRTNVNVDTGNITSSTLSIGAASTQNSRLRLPRGAVDERKVILESGNVNGATLTTQALSVTTGNSAPNAPTLITVANFDAGTPRTFSWIFTDDNRRDFQTAYQLQIQRVSDSVDVYDSGKITSTVSQSVLSANAIANNINYRWRVRTYDVLNAAGTWSAYSTFSTSSAGTLIITDPDVDYMAGVETSSYNVMWTYTQGADAAQTQRRVVVTRLSDNTVTFDTGMQANTESQLLVSGFESGVQYRIDVTIVNNFNITSPTASRLFITDYSTPMAPSFTTEVGEAWITITIDNPDPTGDRPQVSVNEIWKQRAGKIGETYKKIAEVGYNGIYTDYAVKSGAGYNYFIRGQN